jgi:hypothetical protein
VDVSLDSSGVIILAITQSLCSSEEEDVFKKKLPAPLSHMKYFL